MITTIIKAKAFGPLAASVVVVAATLFTSQAEAQNVSTEEYCDTLGSLAEDMAYMRDAGMQMDTAMNATIEMEGIQSDIGLEWVYTLATITYDYPEIAPTEIGFTVFDICVKKLEAY